MKKSVISLIVIILVLIIGRVFFIKAIPQGHVGIVYSAFGGVKPQPLEQGLKFVKPATRITIYPIFTQQGSMTKDIT